jgi:hypothetical protein
MYGHEMLILPFGVLPFVLFIVYIFFIRGSESAQKNIGSKIRKGITEYPTAVSLMLYGTNEDTIEFTNDGKSVVLTIDPTYGEIKDVIGAKQHFLMMLESEREELYAGLLDSHLVTSVAQNSEDNKYKITITLPNHVIQSDEYIDHEINNVGRVFVRNNGGNTIRWLQHPQGERRIERKDGKVFVYIDRKQVVPSFLSSKTIIMSEQQITRNIKNRLWNRFNVKCISINDDIYKGEIVPC